MGSSRLVWGPKDENKSPLEDRQQPRAARPPHYRLGSGRPGITLGRAVMAVGSLGAGMDPRR